MNALLENKVGEVRNEKLTMQVTFKSEGVLLDNTFINFGDNEYDNFVYTLQQYGLRNLIEYAERFTVTHLPLVEELRKLHGTHAGMTYVPYDEALEMFNDQREVYRLYDDGTEGLVQDIESIHQHNENGGEFGRE